MFLKTEQFEYNGVSVTLSELSALQRIEHLALLKRRAEEAEARAYISEAGCETLAGCLYEFPAYRQAMNAGLAVTETRYKRLKQNADEVIQSLIDKIGE